ncbi:uncharacterized protein C2845_PM12G10440 [Panicum miliaceum]|uniref:Uncharacterized protein n=1 Tax=Panicum miliaceum TaxID=4540 RepID=A0A3L6QGX6_PANMI|nr:uncharacterized protein C2845_PM12G10440 [Panicum miliaceum]
MEDGEATKKLGEIPAPFPVPPTSVVASAVTDAIGTAATDSSAHHIVPPLAATVESEMTGVLSPIKLDAGTIPGVSITRFDVSEAWTHAVNKNWNDLENYISKFLTEVQGRKFHHHPGLLCSIYQHQMGYLIDAEKYEAAAELFNAKVLPLLTINDDLFKPDDLEHRVIKLKDCVKSRQKLFKDEDLNTVLSDYLMLYFPQSLGVARKGSVHDFLCTYTDSDKNLKRHRCLACQWVIPESSKVCKIEPHVRPKPKNQRAKVCSRVSRWMLEYLSCIECKGEATYSSSDIKSSGNGKSSSESIKSASASASIHGVSSDKVPSKKRKTPGESVEPAVSQILATSWSSQGTTALSNLETDVASVTILIDPALPIFNELAAANLDGIHALKTDFSDAAVGAEVILGKQDSLLAVLKSVFKNALALDSQEFMIIKELCDLSDDLLPLLKYLPDDVSTILLHQDQKISELRYCFFEGNACRTLASKSGTGTNEAKKLPSVPNTPGTDASGQAS